MNTFKRFFWINFLAPDWYMLALVDSPVLTAAHWDGWTWTTRTETISDARIAHIAGRVPQQKDFAIPMTPRGIGNIVPGSTPLAIATQQRKAFDAMVKQYPQIQFMGAQ